MAEFKLVIHGLSTKEKPSEKTDMSLETGTTPKEIKGYLYSLVGLSMNKQMYQPNMIVADISIEKITGKTWEPIGKNTLGELFRYRKVTLSADKDVIGDDFYVHEVIPEYLADSMNMRLNIFSLDKMLTLKQTSRSFVGKKLGSDILAKEVANYTLPYDSTKTLAYNPNLMQRLKFKSLAKEEEKDDQKDDKKDDKKDEKKEPRMVEHIFPYLVQYNESFYDLLARTTNRWGEFLYYEDGKLQLGYDGDEKKIIEVKNFHKLTYSNYDSSDTLLKKVKDGNYEPEAAYDQNIYDNPVQKSPTLVRGELGKFNGQGDKYAMKKLASFFNTDKNIVSWIVNTLVDDGVSVLQAMAKIGQKNDTQAVRADAGA